MTSTSAPWGRKGPRFWIAALGVMTLVAFFNFGVYRTSDLAERSTQSYKVPLLCELTAAYTFLLLLPFLLRFVESHPIERKSLGRNLPLHALVFALYAVSHTLLMWGSRTLLYRVLEWGTYDYGDMSYRFLMEGQKQAIAYVLLVGTVTLVRYAARNREREVSAARLAEQLTKARLSALKSQLNPHFLFNTLNMISSYVDENPGVAQRMIEHLADFLRSTLEQGDVQEVTLSRELASFEAYLAIAKARFEERLEVSIDAPFEVQKLLVPHLVLQPLVENAVVHAVERRDGVGRVSIAAARANGRLRLVVEDDGPGLAVAPDEALTKGIGLANTRERLDRLYGDEQTLTLVEKARGLRVVLEIPVRSGAA